MNTVLVVNSGSSSLKLAVLEPESGQRYASGLAERLDTPDAGLRLQIGDEQHQLSLEGAGHQAAIESARTFLESRGFIDKLCAIGHRVVHGGEAFSGATLIDDNVLDAIEAVSPLAPLHNPVNLLGIRLLRAALPSLPQVAVFDTAFHQTMPEVAYRYAVREDLYREHGVRKYGFHGTSHRYVVGRAAELLGRPLEELNLLSAHLGNGASATAVQAGKSVDTSMGMTPLSGLVMGTRSGDLDPGAVLFLLEKFGGDAGVVDHLLNHESGLLGLSGSSNDVRTLLEKEAEGDERAALSLNVFCYRAAAQLAALAVSMPSVDALVFTGGIGENAAPIRERIVARLRVLGLSIDPERNAAHVRGSAGVVSPSLSPAVLVVPTDEEQMIARLAQEVIGRT